MVLSLRRPGGELGLSSDLYGHYALQKGMGPVFLTASILALAAQHPFPTEG
jgi:hypothetical protein